MSIFTRVLSTIKEFIQKWIKVSNYELLCLSFEASTGTKTKYFQSAFNPASRALNENKFMQFTDKSRILRAIVDVPTALFLPRHSSLHVNGFSGAFASM